MEKAVCFRRIDFNTGRITLTTKFEYAFEQINQISCSDMESSITIIICLKFVKMIVT